MNKLYWGWVTLGSCDCFLDEHARKPERCLPRAMNLASESTPNFSHCFTLLKELNSQRGMGQFCDCVLKLHIHPGRLFLAHKSVLAAFSPVLASLLPRHGALVDLNFPYLTPETLDSILDYIYTGTLPTRSQEEPVLSAALHLQMDQLQQVLRCRRKGMGKKTNSVQDKLSEKRRFVEGQFLDGSPLTSLADYPYGSDPPLSSSPSCEVVPVICHVTTTGNSKFPLKTSCNDKSSIFHPEVIGNITEANKQAKNLPYPKYSQTSHGLDNALLDRFFESAQSKQDKVLVDLSESSLPSVSEKTGIQFNSSSDVLEFTSTMPKSTESRGQCVHNSPTMSKDVSLKTEYILNDNYSCPQKNRFDVIEDARCVSDLESIHSFHSFHSSKGEQLVTIPSDAFNDKRLYRNSSDLEDRPHLGVEFVTENCLETPHTICLEHPSSTGIKVMTCEKRTPAPDVWHEMAQSYEQKSLFEGKPAEILTAEKMIEEEFQRTDHVESCEVTKMRSATYQGQLHYQSLQEQRHSMADSSDSDSDRAYPVSNIKAKDSASVLQTVDITEISRATSQPCKSPGERSAHPFQCSMCERAFSQRGSLNRHMRSHLGVRPYSCPQCSMTFSRQYRVTEHMRVHQRSCEGPSESLRDV